MSPRPRPDVLRINPYTPGVAALPGLNRVVKLSSNEGAFGPPPGVAEALAALATRLHRYPDGDATVLRQAIGERFALNPDQIVCGAGSDDLIFLLCHIYGGPLAGRAADASADPDASRASESAAQGSPPDARHVRPASDPDTKWPEFASDGRPRAAEPIRPAPEPEAGPPPEAAAELIMTAHGFSIYEIAGRLAGCRVVKVVERNLTADIDAILAAVSPATRMVFLANPNNPTGTFVPSSETRRLRENLPAHVLLVLDAAYAEYVDRPDYDPGTALVDAGQNTVMTRTFSKMFGLGGLRLGWAYAPPAIAGLLNRVRSPFNVSLAAHEAGLAALAAPGWVEQSRAHNTAERARLTEALHEAGIRITPSEANFVLADLRTPARAEAADAHLRAHGLIVRRVGGYGLPAHLRITVALAEENDLLIDALTAFAAANP